MIRDVHGDNNLNIHKKPPKNFINLLLACLIVCLNTIRNYDCSVFRLNIVNLSRISTYHMHFRHWRRYFNIFRRRWQMRKKYNPGQNSLAKHILFSFLSKSSHLYVFYTKSAPLVAPPKSMLLYLHKPLCINMFICANNIDIGGRGAI